MTKKQLRELHKKAPKEIYVQFWGIAREEAEYFDGLPESTMDTTWCADQINDTDIRYVRVLSPKRKTARRGGYEQST